MAKMLKEENEKYIQNTVNIAKNASELFIGLDELQQRKAYEILRVLIDINLYNEMHLKSNKY